jgi:hypothetical protein
VSGGDRIPTYRIFVNGEPTEDFVAGVSYVDAYFSASDSLPTAYKNDFKLEEVQANERWVTMGGRTLDQFRSRQKARKVRETDVANTPERDRDKNDKKE